MARAVNHPDELAIVDQPTEDASRLKGASQTAVYAELGDAAVAGRDPDEVPVEGQAPGQ